MTPLLSTAIGLVVAALSGLLLLALAAATVLLILLALLALDHLLQRNGVDRREGAGRAWSRLRGPRSARRSSPAATAEQHRDGAGAPSAPRVPFSARRPGRAARPATGTSTSPIAPAIAVTSAPVTTPVEPAAAATPPAPPAAAPTPDPAGPAAPAETTTEVLPTRTQPRAASTTGATGRAPRAQAPRVSRASKPALRGPAAAAPAPASTAGTPQGETPAGDRDSAIDRLFAPLLESDRTEPLPRARSARRPDDEG